ncbi:GIY-YIG nuclease family protein [filamentous cyanobacterium LEGE 11480]|uniref:GIY-YIG nuclease family protein n=1 Tax=Romeriopsis navalis LEGE 11480 TaxID=2777977 RepID=A0A928Z2S9_9CYAN|nr:GIY-YIG nuclease family protein [Romeriopsis navalis LEGE 11480]
MSSEEQIPLFRAKDLAGSYGTARRATLVIAPDTLQVWKQKVLKFQQNVSISPATAQASLFDTALTAPTIDADSIDPLALPQQNTQFWRWKAEDAGVSAIYFVFDYELNLLLYVGETVKSNQRWKGEHDCKRYLLNYQQAHYQFNLPTKLGIAFWRDAPQGMRDRQKQESALINKWRSPFNKENWVFWGTPFVAAK